MAVVFCLAGFYWVAGVAASFGELPWYAALGVLVAFSFVGNSQFVFFGLAYVYFRRKMRHQTLRVFDAFGFAALFVWIDTLFPKIFENELGHALISSNGLSYWASVVGARGLSFAVVTMAFLWFTVILKFYDTRRLKRADYFLLGATIAVVVGFFISGNHFSHILESRYQSLTEKFKIAAIQPNIGGIEKIAAEHGEAYAVDKITDLYVEMTRAAALEYQPDAILWPETAFPFYYTHFQDANANFDGLARDQVIKDLVGETKTTLIFGSYFLQNKKPYNGLFIVDPKFQLVGRYAKTILLAFGEYLPLGPFNDLVYALVPTISDFGRGVGPEVYSLELPQGRHVKIAPQICYEALDFNHTRVGYENGAQILVNITNDSWFGATNEPILHLALTRFRSIETRLPMIRSTNTGITTVITPTGRLAPNTTKTFEQTIFTAAVPYGDLGKPFILIIGYRGILLILSIILGLWLVLRVLRPARSLRSSTAIGHSKRG